MVIKQVSEKKSQGGLDMLVILFDFAEGDEQAGYFMKQFENDIRPDKKYPNAGTNYMVIDESVDYGVRNLKTFITCVEKSNPGFSVKWGDSFFLQMIVIGFCGALFWDVRILNSFNTAEPCKFVTFYFSVVVPVFLQTKDASNQLTFELLSEVIAPQKPMTII